MACELRYLDNHLMVINKPAGLLAQADETGDLDVLTWAAAYLKQRFAKPGNVFVGLVHRLDRPVSGLMVLARTSKAAARLTEQFKSREVNKRYLAVVQGKLTGSGVWTDYLVKEDRSSRVVRATHPNGKLAKLGWQALANDAQTTLVEVELFTGRSHQIRVQFASRGHVLLGDLRYGAEHGFPNQSIALHSFYLEFSHPTQRQRVAWTEAPPASWTGYHFVAWQAHLQRVQEESRARLGSRPDS